MEVASAAEPALREEIARLRAEIAAKALEAEVNNQQMQSVFGYLLRLYHLIPGALLVVGTDGQIQRVNRVAEAILGCERAQLATWPLQRVLADADQIVAQILKADERDIVRLEAQLITGAGESVPVLLSAARQAADGPEAGSIVLIATDIRDRRRLEVELRHAQKLEAIGQLAAGIAHEINTPMQFIGDNLRFARDAVAELLAQARGEAQGAPPDLAYLSMRLPRALERSLEGVDRVARIVDALKTFSHPRTEPEPVDLNDLIQKTLVITHAETKYLAEVECQLQPLPLVVCGRGDLSQVLVNLITNAAHAIQERLGSRGERGHIRVGSRYLADSDEVELNICDDGAGVPEAIVHRIYDPFFTTKPVGKGTGQGLSICRSIIVDRHHGRIWHTPEQPHGACFHLRLPVQLARQGSHD